jgi:cytochrome c oxidase subunit 3
MTAPLADRIGLAAPPPRRGFTANGILAMGIFVFTEVMLFAAFISGFLIVRNGAAPGLWPPPGQPRLPFQQTAIHTVVLLISGAMLFQAQRAAKAKGLAAAERPLLIAILMGVYFVVAQGVEWAALLKQGLTMTSSQIGAFFFVIVGAHALHAAAAIAALVFCWVQLRAGKLKPAVFGTTQFFWYFVVLMWPVIYLVVYP